jgi:hypothetical protein
VGGIKKKYATGAPPGGFSTDGLRRDKKAKQVKSAGYVARQLGSETRADEDGNPTPVADWHGVKFDCHDSKIFALALS